MRAGVFPVYLFAATFVHVPTRVHRRLRLRGAFVRLVVGGLNVF